MGHFDVGIVCTNGHTITSIARKAPEFVARFCKACGEPGIDKCPECDSFIRGSYQRDCGPTVIRWKPPQYCHDCGTPYPWTQQKTEALSETIDELEGLSPDERARLQQSILDIIVDTPKSDTAVLRIKKTVAKLGTTGGTILQKVVAQVATESVKRSLGI